MSDIGKLLKEKLEATRDDFADASSYTWVSSKSVISASSINNPTRWTALDEVRDNIAKLDYILQRIVPNYDELVAQYRAIKDIEEAGK